MDNINNKLRKRMKIQNRITHIKELFSLGIKEHDPRTASMLEKELKELEDHLKQVEQ